MKLLDLRALETDFLPMTDVCIVGAGPAGLVLADELARAGVAVTVLESGGEEDGAADDLNEIESVGSARQLDQRLVRRRVLGGAGSVWNGRVAALDPLDFEQRDWVPGSGWPIPRSALDGYWHRAAAHLGSPVDDNTTDEARALGGFRSPRLGHGLVPYLWSFTRNGYSRGEERFTARALTSGLDVTVIAHATVTQLLTSESGDHVSGVEITSPDLRRRTLTARRVLLAAGGIENARILLASDRRDPRGVGNARDQVGRHLMDHLRGTVVRFSDVDPRRMRAFAGEVLRTKDGRKGRLQPGVALSPELQRRERLLNAAGYVDLVNADDDPLMQLRESVRARRVGSALRALGPAVPSVLHAASDIVVHRRAPMHDLSIARFECILEQAPDPDSRITLSERTDRYGTPLSRIDWRVGDMERRTALVMAKAIAAEVERLHIATARVDHDAFADGGLHLPDVAHPTGSTRMSARPEDGVVDADCRVHGVDNLFVAGSSVFPTGGHANPTQTILALAIRLADRLSSVR